MYKFFKEKKKQIVLFVLILMVAPFIITGATSFMSAKEIKRQEQQNIPENKLEEELLEENNEPKDLKFLLEDDRATLNTTMLKKDMIDSFGYKFIEKNIEDTDIVENKDKQSGLKVYTSENEQEVLSVLIENEIIVPYEELNNFNIFEMAGIDFLTEKSIGFTKDMIKTDIENIINIENEEDNPSTKENLNLYSFSYPVISDVVVTFMIMTDGEVFKVNYKVENTNVYGIDVSNPSKNIKEISLANKFTQNISEEKATYQRVILKDHIYYEENFKNGKDYFSFTSNEKMTLDKLQIQSDFLLNFLFETLLIEDDTEQKYVSDLFLDNLEKTYEIKDANGATSIPIELFLWKFDISILVTDNTIRIEFNDIEYLDDLPEHSKQELIDTTELIENETK